MGSSLRDYGRKAWEWGFYETKQFLSALWPVVLNAAGTYVVHRLTDLSVSESLTSSVLGTAALKWLTLYRSDNTKNK